MQLAFGACQVPAALHDVLAPVVSVVLAPFHIGSAEPARVQWV